MDPEVERGVSEHDRRLTGQRTFTYRIAVTRLRGGADAYAWAEDPTTKANLGDCSFGFLTLHEMWATMLAELTTTPAASEMGLKGTEIPIRLMTCIFGVTHCATLCEASARYHLSAWPPEVLKQERKPERLVLKF